MLQTWKLIAVGATVMTLAVVTASVVTATTGYKRQIPQVALSQSSVATHPALYLAAGPGSDDGGWGAILN